VPERDAKTSVSVNWRGNDHFASGNACQARPQRRGDGRARRDYPGARATAVVIKLDIARDLLDPESFVATGVYEDGAALERQESTPEVHRAMALFAGSLAAPPDRRIYDASRDPTLV
jgi:quinol monooxygenase YgiN